MFTSQQKEVLRNDDDQVANYPKFPLEPPWKHTAKRNSYNLKEDKHYLWNKKNPRELVIHLNSSQFMSTQNRTKKKRAASATSALASQIITF